MVMVVVMGDCSNDEKSGEMRWGGMRCKMAILITLIPSWNDLKRGIVGFGVGGGGVAEAGVDVADVAEVAGVEEVVLVVVSSGAENNTSIT